MTFNLALIQLHNGFSIRRNAWSKHKFLTTCPPDIAKVNDIVVYTFTAKGQYKPWFPYNEDIVKNDWKIYNNEIPLNQNRKWHGDKNLIDRIQKVKPLLNL